MKHPSSKAMFKVAETLEKVLPIATREDHLDMKETRVNYPGYECGTIHCHGGWYAIAVELHLKGIIGFSNGANAEARALGFKGEFAADDYQDWAYRNPTIWGNEHGNFIFMNFGETAFYHPTKRPKGARNLQDIIDHLKEVAGRLEEMENKNKIQYPDITLSLAVLPVEEISDIKLHSNINV